MEAIDNAVVPAVPGAVHAGLDEALFWGPVLGGFVVAFGPALLVNRAMIRRGKGCCPGSRPDSDGREPCSHLGIE
jgi:hypothetical protein